MRRAGVPELPIPERFDRIKDAGYDGMAIDLGALDLPTAPGCMREYARTGLKALLTAFPTSIEALRPALPLAKAIGAPFVIVVGQVMPLAVADMIPVVREWLRVVGCGRRGDADPVRDASQLHHQRSVLAVAAARC